VDDFRKILEMGGEAAYVRAMPPNPTIRDVAREAGVSAATASLALRNHPRLRKATCAKVQGVAEQLGYKANPVVSHLLAQLRASRIPKYQATLGLLNASENRHILSEMPTFHEWTQGLRARATQLGYGVNEFWLHEKEMSPRRLASIFRAQNIRGLIVAACLGNGALPPGFDEIWNGFACVVLGVHYVRPSINLACNDHFSTVRKAFDESLRLGYRRPGLVIGKDMDDLLEGRFSGAFLSAQGACAAKERIAPFFFRSQLDVPLDAKIGTDEVRRRFRAWFEKHRPDVILCIHPEIKEWVEAVGSRVPHDTGLIHLDWSPDLPGWAGMKQNSELIGAAGIDMLIGQLHRNELGIPSFPKCMLIESAWIEGATVRRQPATKKVTR
jgi:LacI family transcriptional regulator